MYFGLGFLVSGLLSLLFLPAFWRRAVRLSKRRVEMQMPLSMTEIVAERDQLRAEHALEQRRIEQKYAAVTQARAEDLGELGRRATQIVALGESGSGGFFSDIDDHVVKQYRGGQRKPLHRIREVGIAF